MKTSATISVSFMLGVSRLPSSHRRLTCTSQLSEGQTQPFEPSSCLPPPQSRPFLCVTPPSTPTSSASFTAFATVSVGGIESADGATTYLLEEVEGLNGVTNTATLTIVQGATAWHEDALQETCSLNGKGGAVCVLGPSEFQTSFTGTTYPIFTVGANAAGAGGGGASGGSGSSSGSGGGNNSSGSTTGGAARVNGGASVGWMLVGTAAAIFAGRKYLSVQALLYTTVPGLLHHPVAELTLE
ncbi:hypothetical protein B0H16DRAFT_1723443 [Mycena metata]|uniref:Uncharacterized protein n=1 Tax=Mycena metata TaxID=1033252 RepID=A0AAD7NB79_9AGAR|nr:hypothetical protein B0H16DRAFT_1723443 [Mycena metata]